MSHQTIVVVRGFAFLCIFAAVFVFRRRVVQTNHDYAQWKNGTGDYRKFQAQFVGAVAICAFVVVLIALAISIHRHGV